MSAPLPSQISVWAGPEVARSFAGQMVEEEGFSSCVKATLNGDRALLYQSGGDAGVVAVIDFVSPAFAHRDLGYAAWTISERLSHAVPRAALLADPILEPVFRHIYGRRGLPEAAARRLLEVIEQHGNTLPAAAKAQHSGLPAGEEVRWIPAGPETTWGTERGMQEAIAQTEDAWRDLGFLTRPEMEWHPPRSADRIDLFVPGRIAECKRHGDTRALGQVERYIRQLRAQDPEAEWTAAIVVSRGFSRELATLCSERDDVDLVVCMRDPYDRPVLQYIDDPDDRVDWSLAEISESDVALEDLVSSLDTLARAAGISEDETVAIAQGAAFVIPQEVDDIDAWGNSLTDGERARYALSLAIENVRLLSDLLHGPIDDAEGPTGP